MQQEVGMSATIDLSEYFNSPNLSSDEVFAQEERLAAVLEEAAGGWHASSGIACTLWEIADSSEYVSFLNPQFSTLTEDHPGIILVGFGVIAVYVKYFHIQVRGS